MHGHTAIPDQRRRLYRVMEGDEKEEQEQGGAEDPVVVGVTDGPILVWILGYRRCICECIVS